MRKDGTFVRPSSLIEFIGSNKTALQKRSISRKSGLNRSNHVDYFYDLFIYLLKYQSFSNVGCQWMDRNLSDFIKKILRDLTQLEQHKCE